ncbi:flagellar FliL protein [Paenibacillus phyllosphaerae]|uniref:Flagellar protein FliL n=1 Tax=Paenibacillus phyllosphaerae TaxID=274593 RepID=A0A7W5AV78_9BACL|nr:flagellar basal body-associated FliL family protein [Paenibacillus phyllosphaerae]MBB3109399.1 flagellar FliL protein [Paenibacillus phyllosphaerae]
MKKMLPWLITILLAITLIAVVAIVLFNNILGSGAETNNHAAESVKNVEVEKISADELVAVTSEITDIKTNLADPSFIGVFSFAFQLDNEHTKEEFEKIKEFAIKPIIISTLSDTNPEEVSGSKGADALKSKLLNAINAKLQESSEGKLVSVTITNKIVTEI